MKSNFERNSQILRTTWTPNGRQNVPDWFLELAAIRLYGKSGKLPFLGQQCVPAQHGGKSMSKFGVPWQSGKMSTNKNDRKENGFRIYESCLRMTPFWQLYIDSLSRSLAKLKLNYFHLYFDIFSNEKNCNRLIFCRDYFWWRKIEYVVDNIS